MNEPPNIKVLQKVERLSPAIYAAFTKANVPVQRQIVERMFAEQEKVYRDALPPTAPLVSIKREEFWNLDPKDDKPYIELKTSYYHRDDGLTPKREES